MLILGMHSGEFRDYCEFAHMLSQLSFHRLPPPTPFGGHLPLHSVEGEAWVLPHQCFFCDNTTIAKNPPLSRRISYFFGYGSLISVRPMR